MRLTYPLATDFEGGIRCIQCKRPIEDFQPYREIPVGVTGVEVVVELVCVYCPRSP